MGKLALCINKSDAPSNVQGFDFKFPAVLEFDPSLLEAPVRLIDRDICEKDESTLQLIPYIILSDEDERIFCYSRGEGSGEERLRSQLSIGLGGHMDVAPNEDQSLEGLIESEAHRELEEELGLGQDKLFMIGLVVADRPVDRVHLGIVLERVVTNEEKANLNPEKNVIERGTWMTLDELKHHKDRLELWSLALLKNVLDEDEEEDSDEEDEDLDFLKDGIESDEDVQ